MCLDVLFMYVKVHLSVITLTFFFFGLSWNAWLQTVLQISVP